MREHSMGSAIPEVVYSERRKIEAELLLGAANDDDVFRVAANRPVKPSQASAVLAGSR